MFVPGLVKQVYEASAERITKEVSLVVKVELSHDALAIGLYCVGADLKLESNLVVGPTLL